MSVFSSGALLSNYCMSYVLLSSGRNLHIWRNWFTNELFQACFTFMLRFSLLLQGHRNLSQLPNFAFSIPLALFHSCNGDSQSENSSPDSNEADSRLQDALIMFPSVLLPLMEKCSVNLDPAVTKHNFFVSSDMNRWAICCSWGFPYEIIKLSTKGDP